MQKKPVILHVCHDYPDPFQRKDKTLAVANLVANATEMDHVVFSLNRGGPRLSTAVYQEDRVYALHYPGMPYGVGLRHSMRHVAAVIEKIVRKEGLSFDVVHAHKLTMDAIAGQYLAARFNKPLVCTVRGMTDLRIIRYKPFYRFLFAGILDDASRLFFLAPWTYQALDRLFPGRIENKSDMLPNIVHYTKPESRRQPVFSNRLITAVRFDAKIFGAKNLDTTIRAFDMACKKKGNLYLDIAGGGTSSNRDKTERLARGLPSGKQIRFLGWMDNDRFCSMLPDYAAFVRPSYPETFGMVYIEALFAGLPVLHAKKTGIDGYFPDAEFVFSVDHRSPEQIAEAMVHLYEYQVDLKSQLQKQLDAGFLQPFFRENIVQTYTEQICRLVNGKNLLR